MPLTLEQNVLSRLHSTETALPLGQVQPKSSKTHCRKVAPPCSTHILLFSRDLQISYTYCGEVWVPSSGCGLCCCQRENPLPLLEAPVTSLCPKGFTHIMKATRSLRTQRSTSVPGVGCPLLPQTHCLGPGHSSPPVYCHPLPSSQQPCRAR